MVLRIVESNIVHTIHSNTIRGLYIVGGVDFHVQLFFEIWQIFGLVLCRLLGLDNVLYIVLANGLGMGVCINYFISNEFCC